MKLTFNSIYTSKTCTLVFIVLDKFEIFVSDGGKTLSSSNRLVCL